MNSKILHRTFIPKNEKHEALGRITDAIASQSWFGSRPVDHRWLFDYLSSLYDLGLVLQDELALCGLAAAKHRFRRDDANPGSKGGIYLPEDITVMSAIFGLANQHPTAPADGDAARALARRIMRLYKAGFHDPADVLQLVESRR